MRLEEEYHYAPSVRATNAKTEYQRIYDLYKWEALD